MWLVWTWLVPGRFGAGAQVHVLMGCSCKAQGGTVAPGSLQGGEAAE